MVAIGIAALAAAVTLIGLATLGQYLAGWNLGIDELLFLDRAGSMDRFQQALGELETSVDRRIGP